MVFDGYSGGFVPVDAASFDVTLEPEAVVLLPLSMLEEQRTAAAALERRQQARAARRARPRCDAGDRQVQTVTRARDGLLALCSRCIEGVELTALDSLAVIDVLLARVPEAERARRRRALERRLMARRHERDLAIGGVGRCPLCGRFRRILHTRDGVLRACRGCAQGVPLADLDGRAAAQVLAARRSPAHRAAFLVLLASRFPALA
jgi:uncharacterized protein (DUF983 family)